MTTHSAIPESSDQPAHISLPARIIKRTGCIVDKARNGEDAVQMAGQNHYKLVVMDCSLPLMDGMDATRAIRELEPEFANPVIIGVTGNPAVTMAECEEAGMNGFLRKPARIEDYLALIDQWVPAVAGSPRNTSARQ